MGNAAARRSPQRLTHPAASASTSRGEVPHPLTRPRARAADLAFEPAADKEVSCSWTEVCPTGSAGAEQFVAFSDRLRMNDESDSTDLDVLRARPNAEVR